MTPFRKGLLFAFVVLDAFLTAWIAFSSRNGGYLVGWMVLNIVVIIMILIIQVALARRRLPYLPSVRVRKDIFVRKKQPRIFDRRDP